MADPMSRRALLSGGFLKELVPSLAEKRPREAAVQAKAPPQPEEGTPSSEPPLSEVLVYGTARPAPTLSVEAALDESPPPWSRRE